LDPTERTRDQAQRTKDQARYIDFEESALGNDSASRPRTRGKRNLPSGIDWQALLNSRPERFTVL